VRLRRVGGRLEPIGQADIAMNGRAEIARAGRALDAEGRGCAVGEIDIDARAELRPRSDRRWPSGSPRRRSSPPYAIAR
jgi:hypothetical protein